MPYIPWENVNNAPGAGTIVAGICTFDLKNVLVGILQMVTAPILIGWVWSILWGWELWQRRKTIVLGGVGV
ncbi:unnamed protein product [Ectocarpus sp. CCAP 1310/34]|nr:unnamed protein product [Ectocarpus sp. CCAP 1310/34]